MKIQISTLLVALFYVIYCNGQEKTNLTNSLSESKKTTEGQPKMIRTQGALAGNVRCELQDKEGNIWFSTDGEGAYRYNGKSFTNFTTKEGLCSNNLNAIIEDKAGNILLGTESGICRYDGKSFTKYFDTDTLSKLNISCLLEDKDGNLWFGAMGKGVYRYDGKSITNFLNNDDHKFNLGSHHQVIQDILQDNSNSYRNGLLWFSSWNGGGVWSYDGKDFINFLPPADYYSSKEDGRSINNSQQKLLLDLQPKKNSIQANESICDDMIFSIAEDKAGNIWFATRRHGACRYDGKSFTAFRENEGFVSYGIYSILEDRNGNMWFTTDKNGVFRYDPSAQPGTGGKSFKNFTTKDGLINNSVFSVLEDKDGNLWFGTREFGLSRYDGKTFTTFSK